MKNILILALNKDIDFCDFADENNTFQGNYNNITEAVTKYIINKLQNENKTLDYIFAFVKNEDLERGNYEKFKNIFPQIPTDYIVLNNDLIKENLSLAPEMLDKIIDYKNSVNDDINISINLSDGFEFNSVINSLIQLIKYNDLKISCLTYANTKIYPHTIEEVSEITDINSLINGADEFFSLGSSDKIQEFFAQNASNENITNLIEKMAGLSETLKVCGSYNAVQKAAKDLADAVVDYEKSLDVKLNNLLDKTQKLSAELKNCENFETAEDVLKKLNDAIEEYKEALNKKEPVNVNEYYFSKLLPKIKYEYDAILPKENLKQSPIDIIRWSIKTGFIQQAVVFFTEWIPEFLVNEKYIEVNKNIMEECQRKGQNFSSWTVHFFRAYQAKIPIKSLTYDEVKKLFKSNNNDFDAIIKAINGKCKKLEDFLISIRDFSQNCGDNGSDKILVLPKENLIRKLIEMTQNKNLSFEEYVKKIFTDTKKLEYNLTIRLYNHLSKAGFKNFFDIGDESQNIAKDNPSRAEIMNYLIENNLMTVNMPKENFLNFVDNYELIVQYFRNKMAHAVLNNKAILKQDEFVKRIEDSLDLIEEKTKAEPVCLSETSQEL